MKENSDSNTADVRLFIQASQSASSLYVASISMEPRGDLRGTSRMRGSARGREGIVARRLAKVVPLELTRGILRLPFGAPFFQMASHYNQPKSSLEPISSGYKLLILFAIPNQPSEPALLIAKLPSQAARAPVFSGPADSRTRKRREATKALPSS